MTSNTARNKISFSFYCSILEIQISRQFSWNTPGGFVSGRMSKLYHLTAPTSPPLAERRGGSLLLEMTKQAHLIMNSAVEMVRDQPLAWKWKCFLYASDSDGYKRKLVSGIIQRRERARKPFGETSSNVWEWRQLLPWHGDHAALLGEHRRERRVRVRGRRDGCRLF